MPEIRDFSTMYFPVKGQDCKLYGKIRVRKKTVFWHILRNDLLIYCNRFSTVINNTLKLLCTYPLVCTFQKGINLLLCSLIYIIYNLYMNLSIYYLDQTRADNCTV